MRMLVVMMEISDGFPPHLTSLPKGNWQGFDLAPDTYYVSASVCRDTGYSYFETVLTTSKTCL